MKPLAPICSAEELKKILFLQHTVTESALHEMLAMAADHEPQEYIPNFARLLEKYAKYPTLSEFAANPNLTNSYKWGATFGVAALVGAMIIEEVRLLQPKFDTALRQLFFLFLKELNHPEHPYLIDPLMQAVHIQTTKDALKDRIFLQHLVEELVKTFIHVSMQFGLMAISTDNKRVALTSTGIRVYQHLTDTSRFIDEIGKANTKFSDA